MSEFKTGYVGAYEAEMRALLDLSDELSLFHSPSVHISGSESTDNATCFVDCDPINADDKNQYVGIALARISIENTRTKVKMQLLMNEADKFSQDANPSEHKAEIDLILAETIKLVDAGDYSYSVYNFRDQDNEEEVSIVVSTVINKDAHLSVRELRIATSDEYVKKEVSIYEVTSPSNETTYDISQTLQPVSNPTVDNAVKFFHDCGEPSDAEVILTIYSGELIDAIDTTSQEEYLLNKYQSRERFTELQQIVEDIKCLGREAKQSGIFECTNPEVALPSSEELMSYKLLLDRVRS